MLTTKEAVELMIADNERADPNLDSIARKRAHRRLLGALRVGTIEGSDSQGGRLWLIPEDSFKRYLENPISPGWKRGRPRKTEANSG